MRIALDGLPLSSPRTGVGHYTFELARALARLAPHHSFELISPFPFTESVVQEFQQTPQPNLALNNPEPTFFHRHWWAIGLKLFLRKNCFDVFHGTNYEVPLGNRLRNVLTIHDLSTLLHPEYHEPNVARRARRRLPIMVRSAAMIIADTESIKREICEHLKVKSNRVAVTPAAPRHIFRPMLVPETIATRQGLGIEADFILFVGTIEPRKNLLTLVRAFEQILRTTELRPQLVIAGGEGWLMEELYSFIRTSGIGDRVRFIGYTSDEALRALYSSCRICVYPSLYEGFGLPPLEAMACGAPVITSRIPAIAETVGSAAVLIDPQSVAGLAQSIIHLWNDEQLRVHLSEAGLKRAAEFSWQRTARLTLDAYVRLVNGDW